MADAQNKEDRTIYITSLSYRIDDRDELKKLIEEKMQTPGCVKSTSIAHDKDTGKHKGFAFVQFHLALDAQKAVKLLDGQELSDRKIKVSMHNKHNKHAEKAAAVAAAKASAKPAPETAEVVVRGLPVHLPLKKVEELLQKRFESVGKIMNIRIPANKMNKNKHSGYAFIIFKKGASAEFAAKQLNGKPLIAAPASGAPASAKDSGATMIVDLKLPREEYLAVKEKIKSAIEEQKEVKKQEKKQQTKQKSAAASSGDADADDDMDDEDINLDDLDIDLGEDFKITNDADPDWNDGQPADAPEEDDAASDDDEKDAEKEKQQRAHDHIKDVQNTVFLSNLPFDVNKEHVQQLFEQRYGQLAYLALVTNKKTNLCRGTAFLRFKKKTSYDQLMEDIQVSRRLMELEKQSDPAMASKKDMFPTVDGIAINGRSIYIQPALEKKEIQQKKSREEQEKLKGKDKRNLALAKIGWAQYNDERYPHDLVTKIQTMMRQKMQLLRNKSHLHVSPVRLCIHFIPGFMKTHQLKQLFLEAASNRALVERSGPPKIVQVKIVQSTGANGAPLKKSKKAKRFGFVQFTKHEHALAALNSMNGWKGVIEMRSRANTKEVLSRLFTEFALEDVFKVRRLQQSQKQGAEKAAAEKARKSKQQQQDEDGDETMGEADGEAEVYDNDNELEGEENEYLLEQSDDEGEGEAAAAASSSSSSAEKSSGKKRKREEGTEEAAAEPKKSVPAKKKRKFGKAGK